MSRVSGSIRTAHNRSSREAAKKPTLAIISPSLEDGGTERYMRTLTDAAISRGWNVVAAFPDRDTTAALSQDLIAAGARTKSLEIGNYGRGGKAGVAQQIARNARATLRLIRDNDASSVMVVLPHPDLAPGAVLGASLTRIPSVTSVHLVRESVKISALRKHLYSLSKRLGTEWVVVSKDNQAVLANLLGWSRTDVHLVYLGIQDTALIDPSARARARTELRAELSLPDDAQILLTVARLNPQKGHNVIIDSMPDVLRARQDVWWVWAGDGMSRSLLETALGRTRATDRVRILGHRDDVPRLLAGSDLFLFPTRFEGLGMAVLEAHLAILPVIASDAGPLPEIIRDQQDGLVIPIGDGAALAKSTLWALEHPDAMKAMATKARKRVLDDFSVGRMSQETFHLLDPRGRPESSDA